VLPEKVGRSSPKNFRGCYPLRPPIVPNFIEIGQTSSEKSVKNVTFSVLPDVFFVTDGQKRDYLSRVSQSARGATKNSDYIVTLYAY